MNFDPNNKIVQRCAQGMMMEGEGKKEQAKCLFTEAWDISTNDLERFIAAHYLARQQDSIQNKLKWDETALACALKINDEPIKACYPSLYLNIAKCHEDLQDFDAARKLYETARLYIDHLPEDGYGKMIRAGIEHGIERVTVPIVQ